MKMFASSVAGAREVAAEIFAAANRRPSLSKEIHELADLIRSQLAVGAEHDVRVGKPNSDDATIRRSIPPWFESNASEPTVALLFRDFITPGAIVYDVGAFDGSLTSVLSRLAGPSGHVIAFEANMGMLPQLTENVRANWNTNVTLVNRAVYARSFETVRLFSPPGNPAATLISENGTRSIQTIALDDFVEATGLVPDFVKIDIEGAEFDALAGFEATISKHHPPLIIEHRVGDDRALSWLRAAGYRAFCTAQYCEVATSQDCLLGSTVRNLACVHESLLDSSVFKFLGKRSTVSLSAPPQPTRASSGITYEYQLPTAVGRFIMEVQAAEDWGAGIVFCEIVIDGRIRHKYYVDAETFKANCRDICYSLQPGQHAVYRITGFGNSAFSAPAAATLTTLEGMPPAPENLF